jgi:hypothetical protein
LKPSYLEDGDRMIVVRDCLLKEKEKKPVCLEPTRVGHVCDQVRSRKGQIIQGLQATSGRSLAFIVRWKQSEE